MKNDTGAKYGISWDFLSQPMRLLRNMPRDRDICQTLDARKYSYAFNMFEK